MATFFPRLSTPAFRPGQSQPVVPKIFGLLKDKTVSTDEVPEIQRVVCNSFRVFIDLNLLTSHQMRWFIRNCYRDGKGNKRPKCHSFSKTTLIRDCGKDLINAKGKFEKLRGYVLGRTRMFYNSDLEFDHPDYETRRINDVYHCVLPPHVIARQSAEREAERLARDEPGSQQALEAQAHLEALLEAQKLKYDIWPDPEPEEPKEPVEPTSRSALAAEVAPPPIETTILPIKSMPPPEQDPRKVIQNYI
jgi:hypothetical protein